MSNLDIYTNYKTVLSVNALIFSEGKLLLLKRSASKKVDPNYWRFFISIKSYGEFARLVGSWHPSKSHFLKDEDIVHAPSNRWNNMNKVSLPEGGDGSPPF